ncbi:MAG: hypothetical protein AB1333_03260 [Patescibacteria group bacterium]
MKLEDHQKRLIQVIGVSVGAIIIVLGIIYITSLRASRGIPERFIEARKSASLVSEDIVRLTNETNEKVAKINVLEIKGKNEEALALIQSARASNEAAYGKAFELSQNLKTLAESLSEIRSPGEQRTAYEAVAVELSLVSEFISYTQVLNNFLGDLTTLILDNTIQNQNIVRSSISAVNEKTAIINGLNRQFLEKMRMFDESL